jgi:hypothetical protein
LFEDNAQCINIETHSLYIDSDIGEEFSLQKAESVTKDFFEKNGLELLFIPVNSDNIVLAHCRMKESRDKKGLYVFLRCENHRFTAVIAVVIKISISFLPGRQYENSHCKQ